MISENIYNQLKPYETHLKTAYRLYGWCEAQLLTRRLLRKILMLG